MFFVMIGLYLLTQPSIGLHCRSLRVAIHFAKEGWICYLPDCVGHGRSSGSWAVVESLEDLAQNLAFVARECSNRHPGKWLLLGFPIFGFTNRRRFSAPQDCRCFLMEKVWVAFSCSTPQTSWISPPWRRSLVFSPSVQR